MLEWLGKPLLFQQARAELEHDEDGHDLTV